MILEKRRGSGLEERAPFLVDGFRRSEIFREELLNEAGIQLVELLWVYHSEDSDASLLLSPDDRRGGCERRRAE
jgi:hypothetical protein